MKNGTENHRLYRIGHVPIRYHVKDKAEANPFLPEYDQYFCYRIKRRENLAKECTLIMTVGIFTSCSEISKKVDDKLNKLRDKAEQLDSIVNKKVDQVTELDSLINLEGGKIKKLYSLINKTSSKLDSIANEKMNSLKKFTN